MNTGSVLKQVGIDCFVGWKKNRMCIGSDQKSTDFGYIGCLYCIDWNC